MPLAVGVGRQGRRTRPHLFQTPQPLTLNLFTARTERGDAEKEQRDSPEKAKHSPHYITIFLNHAYFESADPDTCVLTTPGAIGVKTVRRGSSRKNGTVVFATFSLSKKGYGGDHPDKVYRVIKTLLNNLGAKTSEVVSPSSFAYVDLAPYANVASWRKPGAEKLCFVPDASEVDYRYFPVNRCGWSQAVQNFCPVEEFLSVPLCYDGVYFKFVDPEKNGGRDLLFRRQAKAGERTVIRLPQPTKVRRLHFLGFGMWSKGSDVVFGTQTQPVKIVAGDHVGNWANNWEAVKRGKIVFAGTWDVPPAQRGEKYKPGKAFVDHWFIENPEPDKPVETIAVGGGLAYFAITIEK